jgi:hypothetical protein
LKKLKRNIKMAVYQNQPTPPIQPVKTKYDKPASSHVQHERSKTVVDVKSGSSVWMSAFIVVAALLAAGLYFTYNPAGNIVSLPTATTQKDDNVTPPLAGSVDNKTTSSSGVNGTTVQETPPAESVVPKATP